MGSWKLLLLAAAGFLGTVCSEESRELQDATLDSVDVFNAIVDGVVIPIDSPQVSGTAQIFSIGGLFIENEGITIENGLEKDSVVLRMTNIEARVRLDALFNPTFNSENSRVRIPIDFFSEEFGRVIPTTVRITPGQDCPNDFFDIQLEGGGLVSGLFEFVLGFFCGQIRDAFNQLVTLIEDNVLVDLAGERLVQPNSIVDLIVDGEATTEANLENGFQMFEREPFFEVFDHFINQTLFAPLVAGTLLELEDLAVAFNESDGEALNASLSDLGEILFGEGGELSIPDEIATVLFDFGFGELIGSTLGGLLSGELSFFDAAAIFVPLFDIDIPTVEDFNNFLANDFPPGIGELLELILVNDLIRDFLAGFEEVLGGVRVLLPERKLQFDLGLLDFFSLTVAEVIGLTGEVPFLTDFLLSFGDDAVVVDIFNNVSTTFQALVADFQDGVDYIVTEPVPPAIKDSLDILARLSEDIANITALIDEAGGNMVLVSEFFKFEIDAGAVGIVELKPFQFGVNLTLDFFGDNQGLNSQSTLVLPGFNLSEADLTLGITTTVVKDGLVAFEDSLILDSVVSFTTQEAFALAFNYEPLLNFGFENLNSLNALLDIGLDSVFCILDNFGFSFSAQKTESDFSADFSTFNGFLAGFGDQAINLAFDYYAAAVPTLIEIAMHNLTLGADLIRFPDDTGACARNGLVVTVPSNGGGLGGGEETPTDPPGGGDDGTGSGASASDDGLLSPLILGVVGLAGFCSLWVVLLVFMAARNKKKKKKESEILEARDEESPKVAKSRVSVPQSNLDILEEDTGEEAPF